MNWSDKIVNNSFLCLKKIMFDAEKPIFISRLN